MSYLVATCRKCSGRKILSLKGRSIPSTTKCPYCGSTIRLKEAHFLLFNDYSQAREYWLKGKPRSSKTQNVIHHYY